MNLRYQQDPNSLFFYQIPHGDEISFIIGIQIDWMLHNIVKYAHNNIIAMDSTFITNKYGVSIHLEIDAYVHLFSFLLFVFCCL